MMTMLSLECFSMAYSSWTVIEGLSGRQVRDGVISLDIFLTYNNRKNYLIGPNSLLVGEHLYYVSLDLFENEIEIFYVHVLMTDMI